MKDNLSQEKITRFTRDLDSLSGKKKGVLREYTEALITAVVFAFFIRSFVVEPYKIPSKSMLPTLLVGDHIFVNKFAYGLRIPMTRKWLAQFQNPKRGEVIIFIYPENPKLDFIKRVVGVPGDHIRFHDGKLYVNEQEVVEQTLHVDGVDPKDHRALLIPEAEASEIPSSFTRLPSFKGYQNYKIELENLMGRKHLIQRSLILPNDEEVDTVVPAEHYFVMGDNRDQSADSRVWGFVPRKNLKGRAMFIWLSLDSDLGGVRLKRFGKPII